MEKSIEYVEVSNLPSVKCEHLPAEYLERVKQEIELDAKLGLSNQAKQVAAGAINKEIEALFKQTEYEEVTPKEISEHFEISKLKRSFAIHNYFQKFKYAYAMVAYATIMTCALIVSHFYKFTGMTESFVILATVLMGLSAAFFGIWGFLQFFDKDFIRHTYGKIHVRLDVEDVKKTMLKIPYGAKLKLEEAFDSKLFNSFLICHPNVSYMDIEPKPKIIDPAIIGVKRNTYANTDKWYLICYWDIPKDIDMAKQKIKDFKKFKILG